jgi:hypothetical protein
MMLNVICIRDPTNAQAVCWRGIQDSREHSGENEDPVLLRDEHVVMLYKLRQ